MTLRPIAFLALVLLAASGCDNTIEAPPSLRGAYTLWGALDPTADVQSLRVVPVKDTIGVGMTAPLPVTVTSVDLATGQTAAWRDSVVTYRNGSVGHIYRAHFRPAYESRHRVVVRRDGDGGEISAVVTVPPRVAPLAQATRRLAGRVVLPVLWPGAPQFNRATVTYLVQDRACGTEEITRPLAGGSGPVEFGWQTQVELSEDAADIVRNAGGPRGLRRVTVRGEVASEDWRPPGGVFDFDVLAEPVALGNVEGGYGFVGAAYAAEFSFRPPLSDIVATRFIDISTFCS